MVRFRCLHMLLDEYAGPRCLLRHRIGVVGWRTLLLCWLFPLAGVSSCVIALNRQTASFPFGLGRVCHIIGHGGVAHPVSPHIAWTVLRFSLDGFVPVSSSLQADVWRRPGDLVGQTACPSCT
jgi:hypothetical protein